MIWKLWKTSQWIKMFYTTNMLLVFVRSVILWKKNFSACQASNDNRDDAATHITQYTIFSLVRLFSSVSKNNYECMPFEIRGTCNRLTRIFVCKYRRKKQIPLVFRRPLFLFAEAKRVEKWILGGAHAVYTLVYHQTEQKEEGEKNERKIKPKIRTRKPNTRKQSSYFEPHLFVSVCSTENETKDWKHIP